MNILDLLKGAPDLLGQLQELGLDEGQIGNLASQVGQQLGGDDGFDFSDLLGALDADSFLGKLDADNLAGQLGLDAGTAKSALDALAPKIAEFTPGEGAGGMLGGLVKGLFK